MYFSLRTVLILFLLLAILLAAAGWYFLAGSNPAIDAAALAAAETRMWQAYYDKDLRALRNEVKEVLRQQFGLSRVQSAKIAANLTAASAKFIAMRRGGNPVDSVLPDLEAAYASIEKATELDFNPREAAEAELAWWTARRTSGKNSVENVGKEIARLYGILYGGTNPDIEQAGYLRAKAAHLRDTGQDWQEVESLLYQSYTSLLKGVETRLP